MKNDEDLKLLTVFLAHSIEHIKSEIAHLNSSVRLMDKLSRERIIDSYGPGEEWRGLASVSFIGMVDAIIPLGLGGFNVQK